MSKETAYPESICMSTLVILTLLSLIIGPSYGHSMEREAEMQKIFQLRNQNEWKSVWHLEKHARCRDQLLTHMDWACQKDIYRLDKKLGSHPAGVFIRKSDADTVIKPWSGYVIRRKRESKSITDECCNTAGCTWEEYAEYCPAHRRARMARSRSKK